MTHEEYYSDAVNWGSYQFVPLKEVIDGMMIDATDSDSYIKNISRAQIMRHVKQGVVELTSDMAMNVKALELEIGDDCRFVFPADFVDWVRVSRLIGDRLYPLNVNKQANIAFTYLQDNNYQLLFDNNGDVIMADGNNTWQKPFKRLEFSTEYGEISANGRFNLNTSKLSDNGEVAFDKNRGIMYMSSDLAGENIILEYITDGLDAEQVDGNETRVHKYLTEPLRLYAYARIIDQRRNVPAIEKRQAMRRFEGARAKAKERLSNLTLTDIVQALRSNSVWNKTS